MTEYELNHRAAAIVYPGCKCPYPNRYAVELTGFQFMFAPSLSAYDCGKLMEAMRAKGWRLRGLSDFADECWHALYSKGPHIATADALTWTHAITAAACKAVEGEVKG